MNPAVPAVFACALLSPIVLAEEAGRLPIREITAFKDGHALVLRSGQVPTNDRGDVVLSELPSPIMGAFWADEGVDGARLASVVAERTEISRPRPVGSTTDLLRANIGRSITFDTPRREGLRGTIRAVVERPAAEVPPPQMLWNGYNWYQQPYNGPVPAAAWTAVIETTDGVLTLPAGEISGLRFDGGTPATEITESGEDERLVLDLDWDGTPAATADVSLMYIERGLRWIPSYRVTILDDDTVRIELQATLVNELADLEDATVHMAVGAPSFAFEHTPDPMGLNDSLGQLGMFFQRADDARTGGMLSNAIMSQSARMGEYRGQPGAGGGEAPASPELSGSERAEDLFVFSMKSVTLKKGARMVLPLAAYEAPYETIYKLDLPASPPAAALRNFNNDQQRELARLLARPTARHVLRICNENEGGLPITTAPAIVVKDGRTLAQGLIPYASAGAEVELEVGRAVDIAVKTDETETAREPNAMKWDNNTYGRADIALKATLTNRKSHAVTVEVTKLAFGSPDSAGQEGESTGVSLFGDEAFWDGAEGAWWRWYSWPWWWHRLNGAARFTWTVAQEPGEKTTLDAAWHYFWD
ncbi:MAG: hypothetical protein D6692_12200 [Planctomycetota bacterium]|nr:MAG: hypothetical protein D6692_12200 [Planctomycetota bacterium]